MKTMFIKNFLETLNIQTSVAILALRSKASFLFLLSLMRVAIAGIIITRVGFTTQINLTLIYISLLYLIYSLILFSLLKRRGFLLPQSHHIILIILDSTLLSLFLSFPDIAFSDFFLLYFLPLISAAHYLNSLNAIIVTFSIILSFLLGELFASRHANLPNTDAFLYWAMRSFFFCIIITLYRIQRRLPQPHDDSPKSPSALRKDLEKRLVELSEKIDCATISLQLHYRGRFIIVATYGFPKSIDVRKIEFPAKNERYPNSIVASTQKPFIVNTKEYPHFLDPIYFGTHIVTWMGIPLISPVTGEFLGLISIDSKKENAYNKHHVKIASRIAKMIAAEITEAQLGSASLTMTTKKELINKRINKFSNVFEKFLENEHADENEFASFVVKIGKDFFDVEDCSLFFIRKTPSIDLNTSERVLHLIASSIIPKHTFVNHECAVDIRPRVGLTGYALASNQLLNLGANDIIESQFHNGSYEEHLKYMDSKRSRQIMINPLKGLRKNEIGVLKLENKLGWISDNPFPYVDEKLFVAFSEVVSLYLEQIRLRGSVSRWRKQIHDSRGDLRFGVLHQISDSNLEVSEKSKIITATNHVASILDGILMDTVNSQALESYGVLFALGEFIEKYTSGIPDLLKLKDMFTISNIDVRDDMPFTIRDVFYNIGCEAIRNIFRHALINNFDGKAVIRLKHYNSQFVLLIGDNGNGFNLNYQERINDPHHFGIRYMDEEAKRASAKLQIISTPMNGTLIRLSWKVEKKER